MFAVSVSTNPGVGPELRQARESVGLTRAQLAALANCSVGWVRWLEATAVAPASSPSLERIWRVLDVLGDRRAKGGDA
jgi:transcriptional regulator with XRE-family HTH domain